MQDKHNISMYNTYSLSRIRGEKLTFGMRKSINSQIIPWVISLEREI